MNGFCVVECEEVEGDWGMLFVVMVFFVDIVMIISFFIFYGMGYGKDIFFGLIGKRGIVLFVVLIVGCLELVFVGLVFFFIVEFIIVVLDMMCIIVLGFFGGFFLLFLLIFFLVDVVLVFIMFRLGLCGMLVFKFKGIKVEFDEEDKGIINLKVDFLLFLFVMGWEILGVLLLILILFILLFLLFFGFVLGGGGKE